MQATKNCVRLVLLLVLVACALAKEPEAEGKRQKSKFTFPGMDAKIETLIFRIIQCVQYCDL